MVNSFFSECATSRNEIEIFGERGSLLISCHRFDGLAWYPFPASPDAIEARLKRTTQSLKELPGGFLEEISAGETIGSPFSRSGGILSKRCGMTNRWRIS